MSTTSGYSPLDEQSVHLLISKTEDCSGVVRSIWAGLTATTVISMVLGAMFGDCANGPPLALTVAMMAIIVALMVWQLAIFWACTITYDSKARLLFSILMGGLEMLDFNTDAQQWSQAFLCDSVYHDDFVESFHESLLFFFGSFIDVVHLHGVLLMSIVLSMAMQLFMVMNTYGVGYPACLCGLGGITHMFDQVSEWRDNIPISIDSEQRMLIRALAICALDTMPALYLQTSLFSLTFGATDDSAKQRALLSLALGAIGLIKMGAGLVVPLIGGNEVPGNALNYGGWKCCFVTIASLCFAIPASCGARIYFAYACQDHVWNLTSGCVDIEA